MKSVTYNKILETASDLFYSRGYNLVGINEIIEESDIAKATLYSHFKSKEDILMAYLDHKDKTLFASMKEHLVKKRKGDAKIIGIISFLENFSKSDNFNGCWCIRSIAEVPTDKKHIREKIKASKKSFLSYITEVISENKPHLKKGQLQSLSNQVYLLYEGAVAESHIHNENWPIKTAIGLLKDILKKY